VLTSAISRGFLGFWAFCVFYLDGFGLFNRLLSVSRQRFEFYFFVFDKDLFLMLDAERSSGF